MATDSIEPNDITQIMTQYCDLMEEIKHRYQAVAIAASGQMPVHPRTAYEFCYLQLRMICELIALACVVVHGDLEIAQSKKMKDEDRAGAILKMLAKAHAEFYPRPGRQSRNAKTGVLAVDDIKSGYLTKDELPKLYGKCGDELHKGKVKNIGTRFDEARSFKPIGGWCEKIVTLLNHHQISLYNSTSKVFVLMNGDNTGKVHWGLMKLVGPVSTNGANEA